MVIGICFVYGSYLENPTSPLSAAFLKGTVAFLDPRNICVDTKILIVCQLEAEILIDVGIYMAAILKIQYGRHKYCEKNIFWLLYIVNFLKNYSFPNL